MSRPDLEIGYVVSLYPAVAHAFVAREVRALRADGARIETFSIHRSSPADALSKDDRRARAETFAVLPPRLPDFVVAHLRHFVAGPAAYGRTLIRALRLPGGRRPVRLSQLFHFLEAVPIADQCRRRGILHVHAHFTNPSADVALLVAELLGPRACWSFTAHGTDILDDVPARLSAKVAEADLVVCVSDFGRSQIMRMVDDRHWPKLRVVRCGLDRAWFERSAEREPAAELRLLSVGRLEREKGHAILVEAVGELDRRGVAVRLTLVGDGSRRAALEQQARRLDVADRIEFAGTVGQDALRAHYLESDVFCLPSFGEGIPVVLMEAMATGLPVVASRVMGIPELVEDHVGGLLVTPARPDLLADALQRLAGDPQLRVRLGSVGRAKVMAEHDSGRSARQLADAFAALASESGAAR